MKFYTLLLFIFVSKFSFVYSNTALYSAKFRDRGQTWNASRILGMLPPDSGEKLRKMDEELSKCGEGSIEIRELTISQVQDYFKSGQLSSVQLTECYLKRIHALDTILKSVIETNPDALKIAEEADEERKNGRTRGPLHGIPILIKDNLATFDKMQTTAGATAMEWIKPKFDAKVVELLRNAGAVIVGKTNLSEWAGSRGTQIPSGWSGRGGQTLNSNVLSADPSGSSTGSAVAVDANLIMVSVGTETDGSVVSPASVGSLVGLKTTLGKVSTHGVIPLSFSQDTVGPMARTATDAAILLSVISNDKSLLDTEYSKNNYFRIGVVREPFWNTSDSILQNTIPILELALKNLAYSKQITIVDPVDGNIETFRNVSRSAEFMVFRYEFKAGINNWLLNNVIHDEVNHGREINDLVDIINFNNANPPREGYNQNLLIVSQATDGLLNQTYINLRDHNKNSARDYLDGILFNYNLDALVGPCYANNTKKLYNIGAVAGYPTITIPVGVGSNGVPVGICFTGRPLSESILLKIGHILEQIYPKRIRPSFLM